MSFSSCARKKDYIFNDWTVLNLKHKPKFLFESSSFTLNDLIDEPDSIFKWWLNQPLKFWVRYKTYSFDSNGFIVEEKEHDHIIDSIDYSHLGTEIKTRTILKDSVILTSYYELLPEICS